MQSPFARTLFGIAAATVILACTPAFADVMSYKATLNGTTEVPPTTSTATGTGEFTYDTTTKAMKYTITYSGLSGPATAAHIHGPAAAGANGPVVIPFAKATSPIEGTITLTDAQAAELMDGKFYTNIHTAANKNGEIRGQITK